ncbi:MAG: hypothetical protein ACI9S8_003269 [Chlamydiales bacterium]|jgi:hypothetical protein
MGLFICVIREDFMALDVSTFNCPITHEFMGNPVSLGCGHSFEKTALERWFLEGQKTCPVDRQIVNSEEISYNEGLAERIHIYVQSHPEHLEGETLPDKNTDLSGVKAALLKADAHVIEMPEVLLNPEGVLDPVSAALAVIRQREEEANLRQFWRVMACGVCFAVALFVFMPRGTWCWKNLNFLLYN